MTRVTVPHAPGFACVAVDAEVERLRAEVERLRGLLAMVLDAADRRAAHGDTSLAGAIPRDGILAALGRETKP